MADFKFASEPNGNVLAGTAFRQAVGAASVAWVETPKNADLVECDCERVFDDELANQIVAALLELLQMDEDTILRHEYVVAQSGFVVPQAALHALVKLDEKFPGATFPGARLAICEAVLRSIVE